MFFIDEKDCKCQSNKLLYHHTIQVYLHICFSRFDKAFFCVLLNMPLLRISITYDLSLRSQLVEYRYDQFIRSEVKMKGNRIDWDE